MMMTKVKNPFKSDGGKNVNSSFKVKSKTEEIDQRERGENSNLKLGLASEKRREK